VRSGDEWCLPLCSPDLDPDILHEFPGDVEFRVKKSKSQSRKLDKSRRQMEREANELKRAQDDEVVEVKHEEDDDVRLIGAESLSAKVENIDMSPPPKSPEMEVGHVGVKFLENFWPRFSPATSSTTTTTSSSRPIDSQS